jgi:hypothetical protein
MSEDVLQMLLEFRRDTPEPDAETTRRIYGLATGTAASAQGSSRVRTVHQGPGPRKLVLRVAAAASAAAAIALGVLSVLPGDGPSAVARAAAALNPSGHTILHTVVLSTRTDPNGSISTGRDETWQQNASPYDQRSVQIGGNHRREHATANGRPQYYDARTNTIYTVPPETELPPETPRPPEELVERLLADTEGVQRLLENMRNLLASGKAREDGRVTVERREAIRIAFSVSRTTLLVDADTYEPIEWDSIYNEGVRLTSRFQTYELLPATEANLALLSLSAQHPGATIEPSLEIEGIGPSLGNGPSSSEGK